MKKILSKLPTFMLGAIVGVAVTAGSAVGAATYLKATQSNVKIVVDGAQAKLSESPLNVNGKLYLPVRDTANAMGYSVESVTSSQVSLKDSSASSSSTTPPVNSTSSTPSNSTNTNTTASKKVKNLKETYSTDGKLDAEKIRTALNNGTLDVNAQDSTSLQTLLMMAIDENNYEAYKAIKRNSLNVDLQDINGMTALHLVAQKEDRFYFGELKSLSADPEIKNNDGKKAIDLVKDGAAMYDLLRIYMF
ncbi:ankyrin repeat domain-containing protein [Paenibacillus sp. 1781tsa1]|uniref:ankyrin repeat domain-containing protein n=1 Tax=Paenibacillus sp. 1781tsa1 TaxID=2953810 RepID=UPI0020A16EA2|nr:ankyrin repeat domain-containing protein [Paenibacillus sp. 1781tsa1]MCP1185101.1 ankyrin repeat domain-containing protein [Paenibacillus sp. 1781tsa1]